MVVLFLLAALLPEPAASSLYGSRFLAGALGGSITHQCFYSPTPANKHDHKYWCKIAANGVCYIIISSRSYTSSGYEGRVALRDIPQNGTFTVTMTGLRSSDSGIYRCGIGSINQGLYVSLNLSVVADAPPSRPTQLIQGELHGSVTVLCLSGDTHSDQERFWCKMGRSICTIISSSNGYVGRRYQGRVLITPQGSSGAFKVLMNDLKKEDSGLYLCGTRGWRGQDILQEVVLQVTTASALPRRPKFLSGTVGGSMAFRCHHDPKDTYERKYLCRWKGGSCSVLLDDQGFIQESYRGRIQMSSSDPGSSTVVLRELQEEDAGWYWCGASSGHAELTAPLNLLIHKEICSSQAPGTTTPVRATAPNPAARSTARHRSVTHLMGIVTRGTMVGIVTKGTRMDIVTKGTRMGIVTKGTRMDTASKDTTMGIVTKGTRVGIVTHGTTMGTASKDTTIGIVTKGTRMDTTTLGTTVGIVPKGTTMGTASKDTTMGIVTKGTRMDTTTLGTTVGIVPKGTTMGTVTQMGTDPQGSSAASPGETFQESSSGESQLLPVVLPSLILLICITITALTLAKIKLQKQTGGEGGTPGSVERESRMEEEPSPGEEQEFRMGSGKCRKISAILGNVRMTNFSLPCGEKLLFKATDDDLRQNLL